MQWNRIDLEAVWREAWINAPDGDGTFYETLQSEWLAVRKLNQGGSLSSVNKNANGHSLAQSSPGHITTVEKERNQLNALRYYETIQEALGVGQTESDEAAIYAEGLARGFFDSELVAEHVSDFSCLRDAR